MKEIRIITWQQAQEIIDAACKEWGMRLAGIWGHLIVLKKDIEISPRFYKEMRQACTKEQHELFDKIFGKDIPECPYKDGDPVWVRDSKDHTWLFRYAAGSFNGIGNINVYGGQKKSDEIYSYQLHMPFDPNNLPINE